MTSGRDYLCRQLATQPASAIHNFVSLYDALPAYQKAAFDSEATYMISLENESRILHTDLANDEARLNAIMLYPATYARQLTIDAAHATFRTAKALIEYQDGLRQATAARMLDILEKPSWIT